MHDGSFYAADTGKIKRNDIDFLLEGLQTKAASGIGGSAKTPRSQSLSQTLKNGHALVVWIL
jgi:hypothetical protein